MSARLQALALLVSLLLSAVTPLPVLAFVAGPGSTPYIPPPNGFMDLGVHVMPAIDITPAPCFWCESVAFPTAGPTPLPAEVAVKTPIPGATGGLTHPACVAETNRRAALSPPQPPPAGDFPCIVPASNGAGVVNGMCFATVCKGVSFTGLDGLLSNIGTMAAIAGMAALVAKLVASGQPTSAAAAAFPGGIASSSCAEYSLSPVSVPSPCVLSLASPQFPGLGDLSIEQIIERARRISRGLERDMRP